MNRLVVSPQQVFRDKWEGWATFLGNNRPRKRTPEEWVPVSERLSVEHGGFLPRVGWLQKNGFAGLALVMRDRPELFGHVSQDRPRGHFLSPDEWVAFAERLAHERGGVLPRDRWLKMNKYGGLVNAMCKRPELFAHIAQDRFRKAPEEWIAVAQDLAAKHGGVLPCVKWLRNNGHGGLALAMWRSPSLFAHVAQDRHRKADEEWVSVARGLADKHGGVLPCRSWLIKNNYSTLSSKILLKPGLFINVNREKRDSSCRLISPCEATYDADDPTRPKGAKITQKHQAEAA